VVWYYQELARRVGPEKMNKYVRQNHYGNEDIGPQVDQFWLGDLGGKLRITMEEQLDFLERLYDEKLKFRRKNQRLVKAIMLDGASSTDFKMYGKTGATNYDGKSYGWYVGWIEQDNNVFFFTTLIESTDPKKILGGGRKGITQAVYQHVRKLRS
jgi:beta-lactamase class D